MGTGIVSWSNSNLTSYQKSLSDTYSSNVNKLNENLIVENVWFGSVPSKFLNITMTDNGAVGLNVTDIKVITSTQTSDFKFTHGAIIPQHPNSTLINYNWQSKVPIQLTITTSRGSIFTSQVMPP
jgi:archaellum component FlaF (FlaF/FlaG flagellin family)